MKEIKWKHKLLYTETRDVNILLEEFLNDNDIEDFKIVSADHTYINIIYKP